MGRGWEHFWREAAHLEHQERHPLESKYPALDRDAVVLSSPAPGPDVESLFDE
jgi:hypothetical protein